MTSDDHARLRARIEQFFANNPDAGVTDALGGLTLSPAHRELVEEVQADHGGDVSDPQTRVVHRSETHDVYIGRGDGGDAHLNNTDIGDTGWLGNPYKTKSGGGDYARKQSIALYCADVLHRLDHDPAFGAALAGLKGQRLACYCRHAHESEPACHGDVLVQVIDALRPVDTEGGTDGGEQA